MYEHYSNTHVKIYTQLGTHVTYTIYENHWVVKRVPCKNNSNDNSIEWVIFGITEIILALEAV